MSWGAVFAAVAVALVVRALLTLLGLGVATLDPAMGESPEASTLSMAAAAW